MRSVLVNSAMALASIMVSGMAHDRMDKVSPTLRRRAGWQERAVDKRYRPTSKVYDDHTWAPDSAVWLRAEAKRARKAEKLQRDYYRSMRSNRCHAHYFDPSKVELVFSNAAGEEVARVTGWAEPPCSAHTHMVYCGHKKKLQGKAALVRPDKTREGYVLAQFDDLELSFNKVRLAFNWHNFRADEFKAV